MTSSMLSFNFATNGGAFNNAPIASSKNGGKDNAPDDFAGLLASAFSTSNQITTPAVGVDPVTPDNGKGLATTVDDSPVAPLDGQRPVEIFNGDTPGLFGSDNTFKPAGKPVVDQADAALLPADGDGSVTINGKPVTPDPTKIQSAKTLAGSAADDVPWERVLKIAVLPQQFATPNVGGGKTGEQSSNFVDPNTSINNPGGGLSALQKLIGELKSPANNTNNPLAGKELTGEITTNSNNLAGQSTAQLNGDNRDKLVNNGDALTPSTDNKEGLFSSPKSGNPLAANTQANAQANGEQTLAATFTPDSAASNFINGLTARSHHASNREGVNEKAASFSDEVKPESGSENQTGSASIEANSSLKTELQPAQHSINSNNGIARQVINPIFDTFHKLANQDTKTLQIKLNPENWGEVRLCLTKSVDGRLSADIFAETNAAHSALSNGLADLKENLVQMGLAIDQLNVSVDVSSQSNHQSKGSYDEQSRTNYQLESSFTSPEPSLNELTQVKQTNNHRLLSLEI